MSDERRDDAARQTRIDATAAIIGCGIVMAQKATGANDGEITTALAKTMARWIASMRGDREEILKIVVGYVRQQLPAAIEERDAADAAAAMDAKAKGRDAGHA